MSWQPDAPWEPEGEPWMPPRSKRTETSMEELGRLGQIFAQMREERYRIIEEQNRKLRHWVAEQQEARVLRLIRREREGK